MRIWPPRWGGRGAASGRGGVRETILEGETGLFFEEPNAESLLSAIADFEAEPGVFEAGRIRRNAERFRRERFESQFRQMVEERWGEFVEGPAQEQQGRGREGWR